MPKVDTPGDAGVDRASLGQAEQTALQRAFERGLEDLRALNTEAVNGKLREYQAEVQQAAEAAKAQFNKQFDGQAPESGSFGIDRLFHGYFGYDSWDNCPDATAGSTTIWLDNTVPDNLGGAGGQANPLTIGEPVTHLVVGVGSYAQDPKATRVQFRLNDQPRPAIDVETEFRNTDIRQKYFDTPLLLREDDDVFSQYYGAENGNEALYLIGVTFIESKDQRELDPANMAGTNTQNIVVQ